MNPVQLKAGQDSPSHVFPDGADTPLARVKPPMGCNAHEGLEILEILSHH
jgi:hypothetical protein